MGHPDVEYQVRKEALVALYNLCENHNSKYMMQVMDKHPESAFFEAIRRYEIYDAFTLKIIVSFISLACEKFGEPLIKGII